MKSTDLDAIKLIDLDNLASEELTLEAVELAVEQGCSSWGVNLRDAVTLRLVHELREALIKSEEYDELHNRLKGEQLAHGRSKKKLADLKDLEELLDNVPDA